MRDRGGCRVSADLVRSLEALSRNERQAFTAGVAQLRDEDVDAGRPGRAAVWAALVDVAHDVTVRERAAFDAVEDEYWRVEEGGV